MLYTEEQRALRETARRFSRERLRPDYQKREQSERIDLELVREMGRLGLIGTDLPERCLPIREFRLVHGTTCYMRMMSNCSCP